MKIRYQKLVLFLLLPALLKGQDLANLTDITLTFTPLAGGTNVIASATDSDGDGVMEFQMGGAISLLESTEYTLAIDIQNTIDNVNLTNTITQNSDDFLFFFAFSDEVMTSPAGDGNIDNRTDPMNYNDMDGNELPIGLSTDWETECAEVANPGTFRVVLKNQQGIKSTSSTSDDGITELDISWNISIQQDPDAPPCENEEEIITDVTLTFSPIGGGNTVTASAQDPDGQGPLPLLIVQDIDLEDNTTYELSVSLLNGIEGEDITEEIMEEDDEHLFFFAFTSGVFSNPTGDGNIDNRSDPVNYNDFDENNLPVGLSTNWTTSTDMSTGTFRLILKHQPDIKSENSTVDDGSTDLDLTWDIRTLVSTSEQRLNNRALQIWPNPVQNQLNWRVEGITIGEGLSLDVFDPFGRLVLSKNLASPTIDIAKLDAGMYYLQIQKEDEIWVKRFVKTN